MKKALIIEPTKYHGHVILPQCVFLIEEDFEVTLILNIDHSETEFFEALSNVIVIPMLDFTWHSTVNLWLHIITNSYDLITINTIDMNNRRYMLAYLLQHRNFQYIMHHTRRNTKLKDLSLLDKFLRLTLWKRCSQILVLSETVINDAKCQLPKQSSSKVISFHPSYWGSQLGNQNLQPDNMKSAVKPILAIPGVVADKRNYASLMSFIKNIDLVDLRDRLHILILGSNGTALGEKLKKRVHHAQLDNMFSFQEKGYISFPEYANYLLQTSFILPLIDKTITSRPFLEYNTSIVPSALMLSRTFSIPLLVSKDLSLDRDLKAFAIFYEADELASGIQKAVEYFYTEDYKEARKKYAHYTKNKRKESKTSYFGLL